MKPALPRSASRDAFTLIEILVVIAIIAILASLLLNTAGYVQEKAGNSRAEVEIKALETALESYKQDFGDYPLQADGTKSDSTKVLLDSLNPTETNSFNSTGKIYFEISPKMLEGYSSKKAAADVRKDANGLIDPFGNPYHYQYPGNAARSGTSFFDLWSQGKKNDGDTNKWIKNW